MDHKLLYLEKWSPLDPPNNKLLEMKIQKIKGKIQEMVEGGRVRDSRERG